MASGTVNSCCGFIELRTGCMIIAYLKLVAEVIVIIAAMTGLIIGGVMTSNADDARSYNSSLGIFAISFFVLYLTLFCLAFTVVLLVGVHKKKRSHLLVYLIVTTILIVISICFSVYQLVTHFQYDITDSIIKIFFYPLNIYFLVVIRSYYCALDTKLPPPYSITKF